MPDVIERSSAVVERVVEAIHYHVGAHIDSEKVARLAIQATLDLTDVELAALGMAIDREVVFQSGEPTLFVDKERAAVARAALLALRSACSPESPVPNESPPSGECAAPK